MRIGTPWSGPRTWLALSFRHRASFACGQRIGIERDDGCGAQAPCDPSPRSGPDRRGRDRRSLAWPLAIRRWRSSIERSSTTTVRAVAVAGSNVSAAIAASILRIVDHPCPVPVADASIAGSHRGNPHRMSIAGDADHPNERNPHAFCTDHHILITGGTSGIGLATAHAAGGGGSGAAADGAERGSYCRGARRACPMRRSSPMMPSDPAMRRPRWREAVRDVARDGGLDGAFLNAGFGSFDDAGRDRRRGSSTGISRSTCAWPAAAGQGAWRPCLKDGGALLFIGSGLVGSPRADALVYAATKAASPPGRAQPGDDVCAAPNPCQRRDPRVPPRAGFMNAAA